MRDQRGPSPIKDTEEDHAQMPHLTRFARPPFRRSAWLLPGAIAALVLLTILPAAAQDATPTAGDIVLPTPDPLPDATPRPDGPLVVVATTGILADLVAQVGGARVDVRSLLPANADPHDYEPAPADLVAIEEADTVVRHGLHLDEWVDGLLDNAAGDTPVFVATEGVQVLASDEEEFEEGDPHVWFDPTRVETMIATIATDLASVDPDGAPTYNARAAAYTENLRALDAAIAAAIDTIPAERRKLVTNHDALAYYADRYGLTVVGTVIPGLETTTEPSASDIAALLELIDAEGVPAIFAENTASPDLAAQLGDQAGITVVDDLYTDSLGEPGSGADTYLGLLATDTRLIVVALR